MIKKVTVTNHLGESIAMELRFPEKSGFLIRGIDGLGPPKANINMTEIVTGDGSIYNSSRVGYRNIVFSLDFIDFPTIEETRLRSYKFFPLKRKVRIEVETDNRISEINGYVESNEPNIFSSREGCIVSIICPDPYFYSVNKQFHSFSAVNSLFEFPFSNESLEEDLLEMGDMEIRSSKVVVYPGDASIGIYLFIHATGPASNPEIINERTLQIMSIDSVKLAAITGSDIIAGDDIVISTIRGEKFVYLIRSGQVYNILNALNKNAAWFQLERGDNVFVYTADGISTNLQFRIENRIAYEGV